MEKAVIALSAEAQLPSQRQSDLKDAAIIEQGRKFWSTFPLHRLPQVPRQGPLGDAPN